MSESTLQSLPISSAKRTSLDIDSRSRLSNSPNASPHLPSAILHTIPQDRPNPPVHPVSPPDDLDPSLHRPPFSPFYTLITSTDMLSTAPPSTHHPVNVHYVFSDDEPEHLTSACLAAIPSSISQSSSGFASSITSSGQSHQQNSPSRPTSSRGAGSGQLPVNKEPEQRTIIIDLDSTGTQITSAQSLSGSWQVVGSSTAQAPTWEEGPNAGDGGLMLRIDGVNGKVAPVRDGSPKRDGKGKEEIGAKDFESLRVEFEERMRMLRRVVEMGEAVDTRFEMMDREGLDEEEDEETVGEEFEKDGHREARE